MVADRGSAGSASAGGSTGNIPPYSTIEGVVIFPSLPHVNFLSLLCVACTKGVPEFYLSLKKQYATALEEVPWDEVYTPFNPAPVCFDSPLSYMRPCLRVSH
jgi:hypothetical protein